MAVDALGLADIADLVGEERLKEIFVEEARIMGGLSHDHVAKIIDCDEFAGQPFIVLEYFAHSIGEFIGESYRVETPSRIISVAKTRSYLIQALKGVSYPGFDLSVVDMEFITHAQIEPGGSSVRRTSPTLNPMRSSIRMVSSSRPRILRRVDLPDPEGPMIETYSPS